MAGSRTRKRVEVTKQRSIYLKCLDCSGGSARGVTLCSVLDCPLWEYRCGYHISSKRYQERIETAFAKQTYAILELKSHWLDQGEFSKKIIAGLCSI
jgi:hypothetical protein